MLSFVCKKVPFVTRCERSTGFRSVRKKREGHEEARGRWSGEQKTDGRKNEKDCTGRKLVEQRTQRPHGQ